MLVHRRFCSFIWVSNTTNFESDGQATKATLNSSPFSANHSETLKRITENIEVYCRKHPERLDDLAYTLAQRREHLKLRNFCVVKDNSAPFAISNQTKSQGPRQTAFVFTGQGAQWWVFHSLLLSTSDLFEKRLDILSADFMTNNANGAFTRSTWGKSSYLNTH